MDINCGCFGTPEKLNGMTVVRDGAFTALALVMDYLRLHGSRRAASLVRPGESLKLDLLR